MGWLLKARFKLFREQKGVSLIETVVALGILGFIGVAFLSALSTISKGVDLYEQRVTAQSLAQSQLEIIKQAPYDDTPPYYDDVSLSLPPGYEVLVSVDELEVNKQEITAAVSRHRHKLLELKTIKANW